MRQINLRFSVDEPVTNAFVFFVLALDEQLYDMTDDSFKAPALNTYSRTLELQSIAHANFVAGIGKDALKPFIEELEWSVARDRALTAEQRALCKVHIDNISGRLDEPDKIARGVSGLRIVLKDYFIAIQQALTQVIEQQPAHKSEIFDLAAAFIIQAEVEGFPRRHTYHIVQNVLIKPLKHATSVAPLQLLAKFFQHFSLSLKEYQCLFLADGDVDRFPELLKRFGFLATDEPPSLDSLNPQQTKFINSKKDGQKWLLADEVSAASPAAAHAAVILAFEQFASVVRFFEHQHEVVLSRLSLTQEKQSKQNFIIHEAPDPMHCWVGNLRTTEADLVLLGDVIHAGSHLAGDSASRLSRAVRFHRAALLSNSPENQLIDLWAALEGLLPYPRRESQRIEYFSESLLPSLTLTYPEHLLSSAYRDLLRLLPNARGIVEELQGDDCGFSKFLRILLCVEQETPRNNLIEAAKANPFLLNKLWKLSQSFKSREAIQQTLRQHRRKVKWHLARIYFTRNSIMHSATSLPYLRTLVENLHVYLDTLIRSVAKVAHASPEMLTIEGALQYLTAWEKFRLEGLAREGASNTAEPTEADVWNLVFGSDMALAPDRTKELCLQP